MPRRSDRFHVQHHPEEASSLLLAQSRPFSLSKTRWIIGAAILFASLLATIEWASWPAEIAATGGLHCNFLSPVFSVSVEAFLAVPILLMIPMSFVVHRFKLRPAVILICVMLACASLSRLASTFSSVLGSSQAITCTTLIVERLAVSSAFCVIVIHGRVASCWFGLNERVKVGTALLTFTMSGATFARALWTLTVNTHTSLIIMVMIEAVLALVVAFLAPFMDDVPVLPPSPSAVSIRLDFTSGWGKVFWPPRDFLPLAIAFGGPYGSLVGLSWLGSRLVYGSNIAVPASLTFGCVLGSILGIWLIERQNIRPKKRLTAVVFCLVESVFLFAAALMAVFDLPVVGVVFVGLAGVAGAGATTSLFDACLELMHPVHESTPLAVMGISLVFVSVSVEVGGKFLLETVPPWGVLLLIASAPLSSMVFAAIAKRPRLRRTEEDADLGEQLMNAPQHVDGC